MLRVLDNVLRPIEDDLARTETIIRAMVSSHHPLPAAAAAHVLTAGGKRIRPALVLLAARRNGTLPAGAHELAAAMELIHAASLVHDDVVDGAPTRRGVETVNSRWNDRVSVLVGDFILAAAVELLAKHASPASFGRLADAMIGMTTAELEQISQPFDLDASQDQCLSRIERKTAVLMGESCRLGAVAAGAGEDVATRMFEYGRNLGIAFQIVDDLLDIEGDPHTIGKPVGRDLTGGVVTLPVLRALSSPSGQEIRILLERPGPLDGRLEHVLDAVRASGALSYCRRLAERHCQLAGEQLSAVSDVQARRSLLSLCDFVLLRRH